MDPNTKTQLNRCADRLLMGVPLPPVFHKIEDLIGALVGLLGPASAGNQSGQPLLLVGPFRQIEGLPAHAETLRHFSDDAFLSQLTRELLRATCVSLSPEQPAIPISEVRLGTSANLLQPS